MEGIAGVLLEESQCQTVFKRHAACLRDAHGVDAGRGNPSMLRMFEGSGLKAELEKVLEEKLERKVGIAVQQENEQQELYQEDAIDIID